MSCAWVEMKDWRGDIFCEYESRINIDVIITIISAIITTTSPTSPTSTKISTSQYLNSNLKLKFHILCTTYRNLTHKKLCNLHSFQSKTSSHLESPRILVQILIPTHSNEFYIVYKSQNRIEDGYQSQR